MQCNTTHPTPPPCVRPKLSLRGPCDLGLEQLTIFNENFAPFSFAPSDANFQQQVLILDPPEGSDVNAEAIRVGEESGAEKTRRLHHGRTHRSMENRRCNGNEADVQPRFWFSLKIPLKHKCATTNIRGQILDARLAH